MRIRCNRLGLDGVLGERDSKDAGYGHRVEALPTSGRPSQRRRWASLGSVLFQYARSRAHVLAQYGSAALSNERTASHGCCPGFGLLELAGLSTIFME